MREGKCCYLCLAGDCAERSRALHLLRQVTASHTPPTCSKGVSLPFPSALSRQYESGYAGAVSGALHSAQTPRWQEASSASLSGGQNHLPASQPMGAARSGCRTRAFCRGDQHQRQGRLRVVLLQERAAGVGECHCL